MDEPTIAACRAKVARAKEGLEVLADKWRAWIDSQPYPSRIEADRDTGWHCVYFDFSTPVPPMFSVVAGEIAFHLRSALDYLAWQEATEHIGEACAKRWAHEISFPIKRTPEAFRDSPVLSHVREDTAALMERHQPYQGGDDSREKILGLLHWFNVRDKHRALHVLSLSALPFQRVNALVTADVVWSERTLEITGGQVLEDETKVACYRFDPHGPDPNMRVQGTPEVSVGFGDTPQEYMGMHIDHVIEQVGYVIGDFEGTIAQ